MDLERILHTLNHRRVDYLLIGGVNFLLRHAPVLTYDLDVWVEDTAENLDRCEGALADLGAEWGPSEHDWTPVANRSRGWLRAQAVFCLTTPFGAVDVFRSVSGLESWADCRARAVAGHTAGGSPYWGLADEDMLRCQLALPEGQRNEARVRALQDAIQKENP